MIQNQHSFNAGEHENYSNCSDGEIRLAGKVTATSGRLEICYNKAWGTVCDSASAWPWFWPWDADNIRVVCHQLGFQPYGKTIL